MDDLRMVHSRNYLLTGRDGRGGKPSGDADGQTMVYDGHWHEAYPAYLIDDRRLTDSARIHYLHLLRYMRDAGMSTAAVPMPRIEDMIPALSHARATVVRDRLLLRLTGWIVLRETVRDARGRVRGQIYAIRSQPAHWDELMVVDETIMALMEQLCRHGDGHLRRTAAYQHRMIQALLHGSDPGSDSEPSAPESLGSNFEPSEESLSSNSELGGIGPGSNFELRDEVIDFEGNSESFPQNGEGAVQNLNSGIRSSSCSNNKNTTTTYQTPSEDSEAAYEAALARLRWPPKLTDNERRLVRISLQAVPPERRQAVLDAYQYRIEQGGRIERPIAYLASLCRMAREGTLVPVRARWDGQERTAEEAARRRRQERQFLEAEIHGLEQLLQAGPNPQLERQLAELRDRLGRLQNDTGEGEGNA